MLLHCRSTVAYQFPQTLPFLRMQRENPVKPPNFWWAMKGRVLVPFWRKLLLKIASLHFSACFFFTLRRNWLHAGKPLLAVQTTSLHQTFDLEVARQRNWWQNNFITVWPWLCPTTISYKSQPNSKNQGQRSLMQPWECWQMTLPNILWRARSTPYKCFDGVFWMKGFTMSKLSTCRPFSSEICCTFLNS